MYHSTLPYSIELSRTEMTSDPLNYHREYSSSDSCILYFSLKNLASFLSSKTQQSTALFSLKDNWSAKTSRFHLKVCPKSCKMRLKSSKSAKPFSRYSALKMEIWTILRDEKTEKQKKLFLQTEEQ